MIIVPKIQANIKLTLNIQNKTNAMLKQDSMSCCKRSGARMSSLWALYINFVQRFLSIKKSRLNISLASQVHYTKLQLAPHSLRIQSGRSSRNQIEKNIFFLLML